MTDVTQPRTARGTRLPVGILAAALFALLAFAPLASAAPDPVGSGTTTITLNAGFAKALKKGGVKLLKIAPAKVKGKTVTLPIAPGPSTLMDPLTGQGNLVHSGGIKLKAGKKSVSLTSFELNTTAKTLTVKASGKKLKLATVKGVTATREGFGVKVSVGSIKLTSAAAKKLNKALAQPVKKGKKKGKRASSSKQKPAKGVFKANQVIGKSASPTQPSTVTVLPGNNLSLALDSGTFTKLKEMEVTVPVSAPTTEPSPGTLSFPITGGTVGPTAEAGVVQTSGGVKMLQKLPKSETEFLETEITLGNVYLDLGAKTVTVEVVAKSNASEKLNLGNLGRSSVADVTLSGGTVSADPTNRTVTVQNASATLQPVAAEVLNGFVAVYKAWAEGAAAAKFCAESPGHCAAPAEKEMAATIGKKYAEEKTAGKEIKSGDALGKLSFTAQTQ